MGADHRLFLDATLPHLAAAHQLARRAAMDRQEPEDLMQEGESSSGEIVVGGRPGPGAVMEERDG